MQLVCRDESEMRIWSGLRFFSGKVACNFFWCGLRFFFSTNNIFSENFPLKRKIQAPYLQKESKLRIPRANLDRPPVENSRKKHVQRIHQYNEKSRKN